MSRAVLVRPRERDHDPLAPLLDRIDATVVTASRDRAGDASRENLAGLGRSVSGRWVPPQAPGGSAATPLELGVDEPDERLDVPGHERLVGGTCRVKHHVGSIETLDQLHRWPFPPASRAREAQLLPRCKIAAVPSVYVEERVSHRDGAGNSCRMRRRLIQWAVVVFGSLAVRWLVARRRALRAAVSS